MPTDLEQLQTRKAHILAELATLDSRASYRIDGQAVDHDRYRRSLLDEVAKIDRLVSAAEGPWELPTRGLP